MMDRVKPVEGRYFPPESDVIRFSSGSTLLDCPLGGGWACGRVINIVGDESTGKTLLAIEACQNYLRKFPKAHVVYRESEFAFDRDYARKVGFPDDAELRPDPDDKEDDPLMTVERMKGEVDELIEADKQFLYVVDSLDAVSDAAEQDRGFDEGTYGTKAAKMSLFFRKTINPLSRNGTMIIVSQTRDKIGATWGKKKVRTGGRALDFYASQILWLYEKSKLKIVRKGVERKIGITVQARVEKNKCGRPFRDVEFPVLFEYGIDDLSAMADWLKEVKADKMLESLANGRSNYPDCIKTMEPSESLKERTRLEDVTKTKWDEIEKLFDPVGSKYGTGATEPT
jgi:protein RecA